MKNTLLIRRIARLATVSVVLWLPALPVCAEVSDLDALRAQMSSTLASADYARKKCPNLTIDEERLQEQVSRSGLTLAALRATEEYAEQRDVIIAMEKTDQAPTICVVLPLAHGGYGRGVIVEK